MRNKLSSVFYLWFAFGLGLLAVLMMFVPTLTNEFGDITSAKALFFPSYGPKGVWPTFVGFMLILAAALASGIIALPFVQPSAKVEKIVLISSIAALVIGAISIGLISVFYGAFNNFDVGFELESFKFYPGYFLALAFSVAAAVMDFIAVKLDW